MQFTEQVINNGSDKQRPGQVIVLQGEKTMLKSFTKFFLDEDGATSIEYALIAALIAVAIISGANNLGRTVNNRFTAVAVNVSR